MLNRTFAQRVAKWLAVAAFLSVGVAAMAQSEPTLNQVYEAANAGRLEQAQVMMQKVLAAHPNSAKAHFVEAELAARQGQMSRARESLARAEKLAPGLPFAKADAVQSLRAQLAAKSAPPTASRPAERAVDTAALSTPSSSFPWGLALALGGGAIAFGIFMARRKPTPAAAAQPAYANQPATQDGLSGPQSFGMGAAGTGAPGYGQPAQPAGSGIGTKVMGGLATGLAVGAGVMAAQAIGKSLMGNEDHQGRHPDPVANNDFQPIAANTDLGGQDFGVNDAGSWDDGNAVAGGGDGGGWDS